MIMNNPYITLGVTHNATEEEVMAAYKRLALQYHSEGAISAKMAELNAAYDFIIKEKRLRNNPSGYVQNFSAVSEFADVRRLISANRFDDAEQILDGIQLTSRNAEWNYLKGYILYQRGWLDGATNYIAKAYQLDPYNLEIKSMFDTLNNQNNGAYGGYTPPEKNIDSCEFCGPVCCADIFYDCFCQECDSCH